jgi:hypothetical protein
MGMRFGERKVPEDETEIVTQVTDHALNKGMRATAVGTLEVTILDESDRSVGGADRVVSLRDRYHQLC